MNADMTTCTLKIVSFSKLHLCIFEFTVCIYKNQKFDYLKNQIIVFINFLMSFTDVENKFLF